LKMWLRFTVSPPRDRQFPSLGRVLACILSVSRRPR
jgi:hypothetical protein